MYSRLQFLALFLLLCLSNCSTTKSTITNADDNLIEVIFLHINDVYEIAPLEGGKIGGMARLATLRKQLLEENPNTFTVHAGDFLNPSLIGTIKYEGKRIKGRQMIDAMNAVGVDLATFGNHEFDISEPELQERLNESRFDWTSANVLQNVCGRFFPFHYERDGEVQFVPETYVFETMDEDGTPIKIGIFSVTIPSNPQDFVHYEDYVQEAQSAYERLAAKTDLVLGLTHLEIAQDIVLSKKLPKVPLLMGGHDHDNMLRPVGENAVAKADANVKSAYVHRIRFNQSTKEFRIQSKLVPLDEKIALDPQVDSIVQHWNSILLENIKEVVAEPEKVIYQTDVPLDGRESQIRNVPTNLGEVICQSMLQVSEAGAECAIFNSGSVRIDDQIVGDVTAVDIFRALPYGGSIYDVKMTGALLKEVLDYGWSKKGNGAYLQHGNISRDAAQNWLVNDKALDPQQSYAVMLNDYLLQGKDIPMLKLNQPGILGIQGPARNAPSPKSDIRVAVIDYLSTLPKNNGNK